jgi:pyruvate dehydrogenase E2 component (dihydrolipoamide acetyltransferase)
MIDITMPALSDSMEEGTILKWLVEDGGPVADGQDLVEIETDKATVTHPAGGDGVLEIVVPEGGTVPVGELIARLGVASARAVEGTPPASTTPSAGPVAPAAVGNGAVATPVARRIATIHDVALDGVHGTGPRGRITRTDVLRAAGVDHVPAAPRAPAPSAAAAAPPPAPAPPTQNRGEPPTPAGRGETTVLEPSRSQQLVARRMAEAKATVPHFQVQTEVAMDAAIVLRAELSGQAGDRVVPSLNDFIIKAGALALREHPRANGSYRDGSFELHSRVNVGFAVAAEHALVVPTVLDADVKSLAAIARETRALAQRVRDGLITPPELASGTFTVSNLGMFGMTAITPVINPPQAAILGVGALRETLARVDGEIVDRALMTLTLSCDHRILYGADAARFLAAIRDLLESPLTMAL